jgi:hypothetical protein
MQPLPSASSTFRVSVVLPCLNEERAVGRCVVEARRALLAAGYDGEVVVVDNGSTDDSASVAARAGARVVQEPVPGYGAALRTGFAESTGDVIVMADADGTYPLDRLTQLVDPVASRAVDMMVGARLDSATSQSMPFTHRFLGTPALTTLVRLAGGQNHLTDSQSGYRAFRRSTIEEMGLTSTGMELASEMLIRANQRGLTVAEVPLGYRARLGDSKLHAWRDGVRHCRLIMRLGPHVALWYPGIILITVSAVLLMASLLHPDGVTVGAVLWQPVFAASIMAVIGVCAATAGALLAAVGPDSSALVRDRFRWVTHPQTGHRLRLAAMVLFIAGFSIDLVLFWRWAASDPPFRAQLQMAALAQVAIVAGAVLLMVGTLHRLLVRDVVRLM